MLVETFEGNEGDLIMYGCVDGSFGLCQINRWLSQHLMINNTKKLIV